MYKLIRRISSSFFPRPDRPWSEDATSTAPQIGRKRRMSITEDDRESTPAKKHRADSESVQDEQRESSPPQQTKETEEVKEVTKGVQEVELEDGQLKPQVEESQKTESESSAEEAAAVPLPDSPQLKAAEEDKEDIDVDAEGEEDVEAKEGDEAAEATDATDATAVNDIPSSGKEKSSIAPAASVDEDEVPGLTLLKSSPQKSSKVKTRAASKKEKATATS